MPLDVGKLVAHLELNRDEFSKGVVTAKGQMGELGKSADAATRQAEQAANRAAASTGKLGDSAKQAGAGYDHIGRGARDAAADVERSTGQMGSALRGAQSDAERAGEGITSALRQAGSDGASALGNSLSGMGRAAGESGVQAGSGFVEGFAPRIAEIGGRGGAIGVALAGAAALGLGAGKLLADQVMAGFNEQQQRGQVKATFGWTPEQAKEAGKAASSAYVGVFGDSVNENMRAVGVAMQAGLLNSNATAADMQPIIEKLSTISTLMGVDVPEAARSAGQMVKNGLAKDATEAFDLIRQGQVKSLDVSGDFLDTIDEYSTQFRSLGLTGSEAFGLLAQGVQGGARDTDVVADSLKEMSLRVADGTAQADKNFQLLGVNATEVQTKMAAGGSSAREALGEIFTGLQKIKDPTDRYNAALALFGTKAEDMKGAINDMDLSKAAQEFGLVGGATDRAAQDMSNGATSIEGVKRQVEVSMDAMQAALANAFGPAATDFANWVKDHGPEITDFFISAAKNATEFGGAALTTGGQLTSLTGMVMQLGSRLVDSFLSPMGHILVTVGGLASHLPGVAGESGRVMKAAGEQAVNAGENMRKTGGLMKEAGDAMQTAGAKTSELADEIGLAGAKAGTTTAQFGDLTVAVNGVPDSRSITITDNSPEAKQKLEDLGFTVTTLPDGTVKVTAKTEAAQQALEKITRERQAIVDVQLRLPDGTYISNMNSLLPKNNPRGGSGGSAWDRAGGGQVFGPGGPKDDLIPVNLSNREYVQQVSAVDYYGVGFMNALNARKIPREMLPGYADGGLVTDDEMARMGGGTVNLSLWKAVKTHNPAAILTSAKTDHFIDGGYHPKGEAIDVDPSEANAQYLWSIRDQLAQIIFGGFGGKYNYYNIGGTKAEGTAAIPIYGSDVVFGQHTNHIHTAALHDIGADAGALAQPQQLTDITLTADSSRDDVAKKIIIEGKRRGYSDAEIQAILATAIQESNLSPTAQGGGGAWHGVFQQDSSYPGRDDPNANISAFYSRLDEKKRSQGWSADPYKNIFWLQQRPGESSADAAYANGRHAYYDEIKGRAGEASTMFASIGPAMPSGGGMAYIIGPDGSITEQPQSFSAGNPPEDPYTTTLTFSNPLEPFWWKGEKEYRNRIISDYEKQKAWEDYWTKAGSTSGESKTKEAKGKKLPTLAEAEQKLKDAQADLQLAKVRQGELKADAKESSKLSAQRAITKAEQAVTDAEAVLAQVKSNPSGYLPAEPKKFGVGGTIPGVGSTDSVPMMGMPGEEVIRKSVAERPGMRQYLKALNAGMMPQHFANGGTVGFGGYTDDNSDAMAPNNLYDLLGMGVGAGFAAYNMVEPFVNSAITGKWDLGNMVPQLNTGTTDTQMVTGLVSNVVGQISSQLTEIIWTIKEGKDLRIKLEGFNAPGYDAPKLSAMANGV
ncbi:phage tail tape measure protein [Gordonia sp. CPCC 205515]|uniref:phage tail tape measure protein n=1 Tax=Gordonia sp. CPCC 205515 TaxID=3140791 RepID=UPI003AF34666